MDVGNMMDQALLKAVQSVAVELRIANVLASGMNLPSEFGYSSSQPRIDYEGWLRVLREQFESDIG